MDDGESYYLELSKKPLQFESVNQLTNLFFDETNKQVFAVRSGGIMGVVVKGPTLDAPTHTFRLENCGVIISIKFSPDVRVLGVQHTNNSVDFMNFDGTTLDRPYTQQCKKNSTISGFIWTQNREVAIMTDKGVELFYVIGEKCLLKHLKTISCQINWFIWCFEIKIALLASANGSQLQPIKFREGNFNKLAKVETEPSRIALERDVTLTTLYGTPAILILRHQSRQQSAEVHVHILGQNEQKNHVLKLKMNGRFAINVVDNLILVHHQATRSTQVFDVSLPGESDGSVNYHVATAPSRSIKPAELTLSALGETETNPCELYSQNWIVFQPNIVIDAKLGCMWHIHLCLPELAGSISDISKCTQIILKRRNGKRILLQTLLSSIREPNANLLRIHEAFNHINQVYRDWMNTEIQANIASPPSAPIQLKNQTQTPCVLLHQTDIYNEIFLKLTSENDSKKLTSTSIAYMTSLCEFGIPVQQNITTLLIDTLVRNNNFAALQQHLRYGVITDSKNVACILLTLGNKYPIAIQLALDMLERLNAIEEIQEILLANGQFLAALKLSQDSVNPRKYLQHAKESCNNENYHNVYYFFQNNEKYEAAFKKDERLKAFVEYYKSIFNQDVDK